MLMTRLLIYSLLAVLANTKDVDGSSTQWAWFRAAGNASTGWTIYQGQADVVIDGRSFKATLWDETSSDFASMSLVGSISGNTVTVKIIMNATDYGESYRTTGHLKRVCWEGGGGSESIVFTNGFEAVGLSRNLSGAACKPLR